MILANGQTRETGLRHTSYVVKAVASRTVPLVDC